MMGRLPAGQNQLFYEFCLEKFVPEKHVLRALDRFLDFSQMRKHLAPYYSVIGRPGADDSNAAGGVLFWYPLGATAVRRGSS